MQENNAVQKSSTIMIFVSREHIQFHNETIMITWSTQYVPKVDYTRTAAVSKQYYNLYG